MIILSQGTLVTPDGLRVADLAVDGQKIVQIEAHIEPQEGDQVVDVTGKWVFPGFIDAHTHLQCWTGMDWTADSFQTGTRAAAVGGTTTIVDYATADRGVTMTEALAEWKRRAEGTCTANYAFHMALAEWTEDGPAQLKAMRDAGVSSFKTYFAYDHLRLSDAETFEVLECIRDLDGVLCVHCENGDIVNELQKKILEKGITGPEGHPLSRPAEAEADAVARLLYLASLTGTKVNVVHLSTKLGLQAIRDARSRGQKNIFVETCPQYLVLDDTCYCEPSEDGFAGAKYVMSPPLRKPADCEALKEAILNGEVDSIATDHCSFNLHGQKDRGKGNFTKIPNGGPGIEHRPAVIATVFKDTLGPQELCQLLSAGPAQVFGMWPQKGCLAVGADADICVWNPETTWTISEKNQHQAVDYTPYEGFEVQGKAEYVLVNGEFVVVDAEPLDVYPGRYVAR